FVEETSFRAKSIEGVGTSTTAFVGMTARGPLSLAPSDPSPPLLTSFSDFERYYGGVDDLVIGAGTVSNFLALAAQTFFNNGGGRLYVARIPGVGAKTAKAVDLDADKKMKLAARYGGGATIAGTAANYRALISETDLPTTVKLALKQPMGTVILVGTNYSVVGVDDVAVSDDACAIVTFNIIVYDPAGAVYEAGGLGIHPKHPRYIGTVLGTDPPVAADALTNPIVLTIDPSLKPKDIAAGLMKDAVTGVRTVELSAGLDGTDGPSTADYQKAFDTLLANEAISIVAAPGSSSFANAADVNQILIGHAEQRRAYRIAVLDTPPKLEPTGVQLLKGKIDSTKAALYYPWVTISNPTAATDPLQPRQIDVPPSGAVCGIYARTDVNRGVWKAPANETVTGALGLQRDVRFGEQEILNPLGINCIRALPNRGIRVWGARTISSDPEWKYVNVRRYFIYLEASIDRGTQWAVFEPNGEALWANVRSTVSDFLYNEWVSGALLGTKPEEAYFVHCDRSTMTQNDLDNGRLVCLVGVAALKPAEFVIFRIGQKTADARG
ncbi:MAG: phage tail sheath subtilisin-like domain-containing protein, partial [Sphingomicrobium sp.]